MTAAINPVISGKSGQITPNLQEKPAQPKIDPSKIKNMLGALNLQKIIPDSPKLEQPKEAEEEDDLTEPDVDDDYLQPPNVKALRNTLHNVLSQNENEKAIKVKQPKKHHGPIKAKTDISPNLAATKNLIEKQLAGQFTPRPATTSTGSVRPLTTLTSLNPNDARLRLNIVLEEGNAIEKVDEPVRPIVVLEEGNAIEKVDEPVRPIVVLEEATAIDKIDEAEDISAPEETPAPILPSSTSPATPIVILPSIDTPSTSPATPIVILPSIDTPSTSPATPIATIPSPSISNTRRPGSITPKPSISKPPTSNTSSSYWTSLNERIETSLQGRVIHLEYKIDSTVLGQKELKTMYAFFAVIMNIFSFIFPWNMGAAKIKINGQIFYVKRSLMKKELTEAQIRKRSFKGTPENNMEELKRAAFAHFRR